MRVVDRCIACLVLATSLAGIVIAVTGTAEASGQWCVWNYTCPSCEGLPSWQCEPCTIDSYNCSTFISSSCDGDCDQEFDQCLSEYEQGPVSAWEHQCRSILINCIARCIPMM